MDWELFVQSKDRTLESWLDDPRAKPTIFFVELKRSFGFGMPQRDQNLFFALQPPYQNARISGEAYIPKNSALANTAATMGWEKWDNIFHPVVELTQKDGKVEITAIVRPYWNNTGASRRVAGSPTGAVPDKSAPPEPASPSRGAAPAGARPRPR